MLYPHYRGIHSQLQFGPRLAALPSELLRGVTLRVALRGIGKENFEVLWHHWIVMALYSCKLENHRKTIGKWWFNSCTLDDLLSGKL